MKGIARALTSLPVLALIAWSALALEYTVPGPWWVARSASVLCALVAVGALIGLRPFRRAVGVALAIFASVLVWFLSLAPSNTGDWQPDVGQLAYGEVEGDILTLHNVRNFSYRSETDFAESWETRRYDLSKLDGLDMFFSHWGSPLIAHTIMSWQFADGQRVAISIETRKVKGQQYSAVEGFFRQYPIYYVAADERDLIGLRTNFRGENVWLYRLTAPPENARLLLLDYVKSMNELVEKPEWYNAFSDNCTTSIQRHVRHLQPDGPRFGWRLLVNGYLDQALYERGSTDTSLPFEKLREISNIDARAKAAGQGSDFSERIREGLPDPRAASRREDATQ